MAYLKITGIQSYKELDEWLGERRERVVGYKTVARRGDVLINTQLQVTKTIIIRQWNTDIYVLTEKDIAILNVGDWFTVTTKQRLNDLLPLGLTIDSVKGRWHLVRIAKILASTNPDTVGTYTRIHEGVFYNGMQINIDTKQVINRDEAQQAELAALLQDQENAAMKKKIAAYIKGLTDEKIREITQHSQLGDCAFCQWEYTTPSIPIWNDHLESHIEERHYFTSILLNACRAAKRGNPEYAIMIPPIVRHDLGKYLRKRLLKGVAVA